MLKFSAKDLKPVLQEACVFWPSVNSHSGGT